MEENQEATAGLAASLDASFIRTLPVFSNSSLRLDPSVRPFPSCA